MPLQLSLFDLLPELPELPEPPSPAKGAVLVARGALAAEKLLLSQVEELIAASRRDPSLLALPVRIVVPSRSLRAHLAAAIVRVEDKGRQKKRSVAGVTIQTLHGLAFEVLERAGESAPRGMRVADVLAQRMARSEPALRRGLENLADGYTAAAATVRDLLDAGLEPEHVEAADEALASDGVRAGTRAEVERARALVRVAARTELAMREIGLGRLSTLLRLAAERVAEDPGRSVPARAVFIHGFAEATGVATDLLQALVRHCKARLVLDRPLDPGAGTRGAAGVEIAYTERLAERLAFASFDPDAPPPAVEPAVRSFEAAGSDAEVREAAQRIRELLDEQARPESIGIVARDLGRYRLPLRRHFARLGIPFSGVGEHGALEPAGRRARAFLDLLRRGEDAAADRWLDAIATLPVAGVNGERAPLGHLQVDLRLAFYSLGAGRLREVAGLPVDAILRGESSYALPIRQGLRSGKQEDLEDEAEEGANASGTYAARRRVAGAQIRRAVRAAGRLRDRLASWPEQARAGEHLDRLRALALRDLGWDAASPEARPVFAAFDELEREVPAELSLSRDELRLLLESVLRDAGTSDIGGRGGGVQVLSVMESRGRTFDHLFLIGLNRDVFPRGVREDPLLPDDLRRVLRRVLPDIPIKRAGFDEERYLFAQLLSASPAVTLSWQIADEDGKPISPSPLVGRLRGEPRPEKAPSLFALPLPGDPVRLRPAAEHAVIAALYAPRRRFAQALPIAVQEALEAETERGAEAVLSSPPHVAAARLAVLGELDPDRRTPEGRAAAARLGPYFGFIGALAEAVSTETDPRRSDIYVTSLEGLAACPWQLFLGRLLRIEPTPDPLEAAPGADPLMLGNIVHAVLERIVRDSPEASEEEDFAALSVRPPFLVPWPAGEELERVAREEAARLLAEDGLFLAGLARALAERALPLLENARLADWGETGLFVLGSEVQGVLPVRDAAGRIRSVRFKADRVDLAGGVAGRGGQLRSTDYKTGKPISEVKTPEVRRRHFLNRVREGKNLQGVAYLLAVPRDAEAPRPAVGRYLYLKPELAEREFEVGLSDQDFLAAFGSTAEAVLGVWDAGSFFPRLVDPKGIKEPVRCSFCAVSEACLRNDSGSRLRLFEWTEQARPDAGGPAESSPKMPGEEALLRVWSLPAKEERSDFRNRA